MPLRSTWLSTLPAILIAQIAFAQAPGNSDRYIIELAPGNSPDQVATGHGLVPTHVFSQVLNGFAASIPPGRLQALARDPRVANIVEDHRVSANPKPGPQPPPPPPATEVIPAGVARVWGGQTSPGGYTGLGIGVAVLDTGLDFNHQDLNISSSSHVSPGFTYTTSAQDDVGHGTHVGGIIAAKLNGLDVVGVAPGATLYAAKVLDNTGSGWDSDIADGLDWVLANAASLTPSIRVVNMSLGRLASSDDSVMHLAIRQVVAAGITVVVSAGNDERYEVSQMVPAGFPEVIAVASTTAVAGTSNSKRASAAPADTASFFTTDGKYNTTTGIGVTISAPGEQQENVEFPFINSVGILSIALGGGTTRMSGTSMAAPHVTGAVAVLLQKTGSLTPADIKARVRRGDKAGTVPLNSIGGSYTFDGEREGILSVQRMLALP